MGEKLKEASQTVFENTTSSSYGRPWTRHFVFACILIRWTSALSQSSEFLLLLWVTWRKSQHPLHPQVLVHVKFPLLCLSVQGKYLPRESAITNILFQYPCQSMFIWSTNYISVTVSCRWWGIHQGPPLTSIFPLTSTHYPGLRLRNQLVPWDLHASMEGLLVSDSGFASLTPDRMIPRMFDFSSSIHIRWNVLEYLGNH